MAFARLIRIWHLKPEPGLCRRCRGRVKWVTDDRGKPKPFRPEAKPIRLEDKDERGRVFAIYEPDAFHRCPRKTPVKPARAVPQTERLPL